MFAQNTGIDEILKQITMLQPDSLVLSLSYSRDSNGRVFDHTEIASILSRTSPVPVYAVHQERLGNGIIGGWLLGGKTHGEQTAHIALRILQGAQPGGIPVDMKPASRPMFDYAQMLRFGISSADIPEGSIVINRPESFYEKYGRIFWMVICIISLLTAAIILLSINNMRRRRAEEELRLSREQFALAIEATNDGLFDWDMITGQAYFSPRYYTMLGYDSGELPASYETWQQLLHPDDLAHAEKIIKQYFDNTIQSHDIEFRMRTKSGNWRWIRSRGRAVELDSKGKTLRMVGTHTDITENKHAEESLRESERKYRELIENANSSIMRWKPDGTITFFNDFAQRFFGYGEDAIIGRNLLNTIVPELESTGRDLTEMIRAIGEHPENFISSLNENICRDGRRVWISWANRPVFDAAGHLEEILSIGSDVTERRLAEELRLQLYAAIEQAAESISIIDKQSCYVYVNPALERMSGYSRNELIGQHTKMMFTDEYMEKYLRESIQPLVRGEAWEGTIIKKRHDGTLYEVEAHISPVRNDAGQIISFVTVESDVTRERDLERQLQQAQKMEAIGTLAGGIAHDFNNILGIIIGYTELALTKIQPGNPVAGDLDQVLLAADRARNLVRQILAFSRKTDNKRHIMDPVPILNETLKLLRATIPTTINIQQDLAADCGHILADPTELHQVIMNLCTNAAHAMETTGGTLMVRIAACSLCGESAEQFPGLLPGSYVRILVSDTGTGIAPDIIERIFDPFFTTKEVGKGTGMGLAVVHGIIKSLGGGIRVASTTGSGTTFEILIPETSKAASSNQQAIKLPTSGTGRILFVDDEKILAEMGQRMLVSLGYDAVAVEDSREAFAMFKSAPYSFDLIITDQTMPHLTGYELARQVLALRPDMPIILSTGYSETVTENTAAAAGICALLMKPLRRHELSETIHRILNSQA